MTEPGVASPAERERAGTRKPGQPTPPDDDRTGGDDNASTQTPVAEDRPLQEREEQEDPGTGGPWNPETHGENPADRPETAI